MSVRRVAMALAYLVLLAVPSLAFASTVVHYYGPNWVMNPGQDKISGYAPRDYNIMYRPAGTNAIIAYQNTNGTQWGFVGPTTANPVHSTSGASYAAAVCFNDSASTIINVTCDTTTP